MKICHMTSVHQSTDVRIFYKECSSLVKFGHEVTLVACGNGREENGVHVIGVGPLPKSRIKRMFGFSKRVYKAALAVDADVYHLHDPELLPYVKKLKRKGKKVIFDSHENTLEQMYEKTWIPKIFRKFIGNQYKKYAIKAFRKADALISVTPYIVEMLSQINEKTYLVTNYPIIRQDVQLSSSKLSNEEFVLCFTGGISSAWSHETIIDCIEQIPDCKYVMCGSADSDYLCKLQKMKGWSNVDYLGVVPKDKAFNVQNTSNVGMALLVPSFNTNGTKGTIGNTKIFEYMTAGIPLICTCFDLWKDIIDEYKCGICVNPDNKAEIIHAIDYLKSNADEAKRMGDNGFRAVKERFNWYTQEYVLNKLYTDLEMK